MHIVVTNVNVMERYGTALALLYFGITYNMVSAALWQITLEPSQAVHAQYSVTAG